MTIKRRWTTKVPLFGSVRRSKVLKPGHEEEVIIESWNEDFRGKVNAPKRLKVISEDEIVLEETKERKVPVYTLESFVDYFYTNDRGVLKDAPIYERYVEGDINSKMLSEIYGEVMLADSKKGIFDDKEVSIKWEPTLSSQARK